MIGHLEALLRHRDDARILISLGIPERLGDRCIGLELNGQRMAIIERHELPEVIDALPACWLRERLSELA